MSHVLNHQDIYCSMDTASCIRTGIRRHDNHQGCTCYTVLQFGELCAGDTVGVQPAGEFCHLYPSKTFLK